MRGLLKIIKSTFALCAALALCLLSPLLALENAQSSESSAPNSEPQSISVMIESLKAFSKEGVKSHIEAMHDPFAPFSHFEGHDEAEPLALEATFNDKALVSGKWLQKGEAIGGYVIEEILPTSITLRRGSSRYILSLFDKGIRKLER